MKKAIKNYINKHKARKAYIKSLPLEEQIRIQVEKDKAIFLILFGTILVVIGGFYAYIGFMLANI